MDLIKKYIVGIVLILVILVVWLGLTIVKNKVFVNINANAYSYTKPIKPVFDKETLKRVSDRTNDSFPVLPNEFFDLKDD